MTDQIWKSENEEINLQDNRIINSLKIRGATAHLLAQLAADCLDWVSLISCRQTCLRMTVHGTEPEMHLKTKQFDAARTQQTVIINYAYLWTEV